MFVVALATGQVALLAKSRLRMVEFEAWNERFACVSNHRRSKKRLCAKRLQRLRARSTACAKRVWRLQEGNAYKLHHTTYHDARKEDKALVADLHIQARQKASEAVKSALTRQKQGRKASQPKSQFCAPRFNDRTFKVDWESGVANLSTVQGRQKMAFCVPAYARYGVGLETATADLVCKKGK